MGRVVMGSDTRVSEQHTIRGILVVQSGGNWAVELTDSKGETVFQAGKVADEPYFAPVHTTADAFNMTTATNISKVILYT